jgi:hypothetical protein
MWRPTLGEEKAISCSFPGQVGFDHSCPTSHGLSAAEGGVCAASRLARPKEDHPPIQQPSCMDAAIRLDLVDCQWPAIQ